MFAIPFYPESVQVDATLYCGEYTEVVENIDEMFDLNHSMYSFQVSLEQITKTIIKLRPEVIKIEYRFIPTNFTFTILVKDLLDKGQQSTYKDSLGY
jgi:urate oxidase